MGTAIYKSKRSKKNDVAVSDNLPFFWSLGMADTDEIGTADLASGADGAAVDVGDNAGDAGHPSAGRPSSCKAVGFSRTKTKNYYRFKI